MNKRQERVQRLTRAAIIAVVRAPRRDLVVPLSEALVAGGVTAIEVTTTTPDALNAIRDARAALGARAMVGVGTVLENITCRGALDAGAEFVVSPILRTGMVPLCHAADVPVMLGAFTPTEAQLAYEAGSDFVKLFPADSLGPAFVKAVRAPLPHLRLVPTGGVDLSNVVDFLNAGCAALGAGSSLVSAEILRDQNWPELTRRAAAFMAAVRSVRPE
ncbi:MAG: bifunctional 4-hydroxy-2-oxoglutarate aldolase/2-dehydro-3-deoxy-phosphogluconate aldolase [Verrucomicrobiales bacterium]|nr:bifunctional 4-hydroxy-2-oxoglutarate aldolase/2-dehydro-3-deoxy-phosphogluconate aldolase [Verrucomicrobiales bacterium]